MNRRLSVSKSTGWQQSRLRFEQLESRHLLAVGSSDQPAAALADPADASQPLAAADPLAAAPVETLQTLNTVSISSTTGEKPQSKVWENDGRWFAVLADSSGTWVFRLDGTTWTKQLKLSTSKSVHADTLAIGDITHVLLFSGPNSSLASLEYVAATQSYQFWSDRPALSPVTLNSAVETATIDVDSKGRMWLVSDGSTTIEAHYSDGPYTTWSDPITLATGIKTDDISDVIAMPGGKIGVFWSNQVTERFGFRTHIDGDDPNNWSADEVPASQSALNVGAGMADDHLHLAVASDGTLYVSVKTSYDKGGYVCMGLLVRRPDGSWDPLYTVDNNGTRPVVVINEAAGWLRVIYTSNTGGGKIVYRQSSLGTISLGPTQVLISSSTNDVTTTKQHVTDQLVVLAGGSSAKGVLVTGLAPPANQAPHVNAGFDQTVAINLGATLNATVTDDSLPSLIGLTTTWSQISGPGTATFGDASAVDTTASFDAEGTYVLQLSATDGEFTTTDLLTVEVGSPAPLPPPEPVLVTTQFQDGVGPTGLYAGTRDTGIRGDKTTNNTGSAGLLTVDGSPDRAVFLKWDVSQIPVGTAITASSITLQITDGSKGSYEIYGMNRDWVETGATWKQAAAGQLWSAAGAQGAGDHGSTVLGTILATKKGAVTINLNDTGVALVQSWVNDPASNYGFIIQDYAGSSDGLEFSSREAPGKGNRPMLSITYDSSNSSALAPLAAAAPSDMQASNPPAPPPANAPAPAPAPAASSPAPSSSSTTSTSSSSNTTSATSTAKKSSNSVPSSVYDAIYKALGKKALKLF